MTISDAIRQNSTRFDSKPEQIRLTPQQKRILRYMQSHRSITQRDANEALGITKLATRIGDMRRNGILIDQDWDEGRNRYGEKCRFMRYWLKEGGERG